ncbi:MAG: flagellar hook-basal body protein [Terriglobia bacterium]
MGSGFYAAFSGLAAKTQELDLLASNLANVSTTGYKGQLPFYTELEASNHAARLGPLNRAINDFGILGGAAIDLSNGSIETTGNDLDVALEGSGFLTVQTSQGLRYTRNGSLKVGVNGELETQSGDLVLGQQSLGQPGVVPPVPIQVPSGKVSISADGTLSHEGTVVDRLRIADFAPGTQLAAEGNSYYSAPAGSEQPAADPRVRQGAVEASNLNAVEGTVSLIELQRQTELMQNALTIFHNDFNQAAAQTLPGIQ